jgi:hypothetical protein
MMKACCYARREDMRPLASDKDASPYDCGLPVLLFPIQADILAGDFRPRMCGFEHGDGLCDDVDGSEKGMFP